MAKIDTQFMTKRAEKPYPLGPHIPDISHIREYPPRGGVNAIRDDTFTLFDNKNTATQFLRYLKFLSLAMSWDTTLY